MILEAGKGSESSVGLPGMTDISDGFFIPSRPASYHFVIAA